MTETTRPGEIPKGSRSPGEVKPEVTSDAKKESNTGGGKSISALIQELLQDQEAKKAVIDEIMTTNDAKSNKKTTSSWAEKITTIFTQIKNPTRSSEVAAIPAVIRDVITKIPAKEINTISSPLLYTLLEAAANPSINWESAADIAKVVGNIFVIRGVDTDVARLVLRPLHDKLLAKGTPESELKNLKDFLDPPQKTKEEIAKERKEMNQRTSEVYREVYHFPISDQIANRIEEEIRLNYGSKIADGSLTPALQAQLRMQMRLDASARLHNQVIDKFTAMHAARTPKEREVKEAEYIALISSLQGNGEISEDTFRRLEDVPKKMKDYYDMVDKSTFVGHDFVDQLQHISAMSLTEDQTKLLDAMGDVDRFERFIMTADKGGIKRYINPKGQVNWQVFYGEIKEIFDEILSVADSKPNQFHQEAFNQMYEGHLYKILLKQIDRLGVQLEGKGSPLAKLDVIYQDIASSPSLIAAPADNQSRTQYRFWIDKKTDFGTALQTLLVNRMTKLQMDREHLHNIQAICNLGLGWEQLSQYTDRLGNANIDWFVHEDPDLSKALQLYMTSLQDEVSTNHGIMRTDFGHNDDLANLSITARRALWQMVAHLKQEHPEFVEKGDGWFIKKARQKIMVAQALAQGVSGDFWTTLLTARMPMGYTYNKDTNEFDVKTAYTGTESPGYEKMVTALDLDLTLERFGLPKYYNAFRWVFQSRNLDKTPDPYSREGMFLGDHGNAYEYGGRARHAFFAGADEKMMDFDEKYISFYENIRTKCVGMMHRGGWRMINWESHLKTRKVVTVHPDRTPPGYTEEVVVTPENFPKGKTEIDFAETLKEMQRIGSYLVRQFLDSVSTNKGLFDLSKMTDTEVKLFCGLNKPGSALTPDEIKTYFSKQALYEYVLFGQIERVRPSHFLRLERRRFTPGKIKGADKGEDLIQDDLVNYLKTRLKGRYFDPIIEDQIYKMYVSALGFAEKTTWWDKRAKGDTDYTFSIDDLIAHKDEIKEFIKLTKKDYGNIKIEGQDISIIESEDEAFEVLKGFFEELRTSIGKERGKYGSDYTSKETLRQRFTRFLLVDTEGDVYANSAMGDIVHRLISDDFDLSEFFFSAGGGRATARYMGETHLVAKDMIPALRNIIDNGISTFVKGTYKDVHDVEKAMEKCFIEDIKKIHTAISMMDKDQADRYVVQLAVFITQLIGKDTKFRPAGLGAAFESWVKRKEPTTAVSMMQDFFPSTLDYPSTSLNSDMIYAFGHAFMKACNISPKEPIAKEYVQATTKILGKEVNLPWKKRINKGEVHWEKEEHHFGPIKYYKWAKHYTEKNKTTFETFEKGARVTPGAKIIETIGPAITWAMLLILFMMIKEAFEKNKKK